MHDEIDEVHPGFSGETLCSLRRDARPRQPGLEHCGGIVIPQLGDDDEPPHQPEGNDAEVSNADWNAGQHPVRPAIQCIEHSKRHALGSPGALREDHRAPLVLVEACEQAGDVLRGVFAVTIHDDDGVWRPVTFDERQCDGDRPLVTDVAP